MLDILRQVLSIVLIDLILSGDNALVIGLASRALPRRQRRLAIAGGTFGAVALRVALASVVTWLLAVPWLQGVGSLLLVWIAIKLLLPSEPGEQTVAAGRGLRDAIVTIIVADFVMSLDNVLAVAGIARGHIPLLVAGLALSIPLIMTGSSLVAALMNRWPGLVYVGSGVLGWTAGEIGRDALAVYLGPREGALAAGAQAAGAHAAAGVLASSWFEWGLPAVFTVFVLATGVWLVHRRGRAAAVGVGEVPHNAG